MTEEQRLEHAVLVHGLEVYECACLLVPDPRCAACNGHGEFYRMDTTPCGRADCPIGRRPQ